MLVVPLCNVKDFSGKSEFILFHSNDRLSQGLAEHLNVALNGPMALISVG